VILGIAIAIGVRTCRDPNAGLDYLPEEQQEALESGLILRDVTLEQQDENGQLLWRVNADEVTYSPDQESADLSNADGELYQDGELLYRFKADRGTILDNGQVIFLEDNIVATGIQNQMVLRGDRLEWDPEQDVLVVRDGITGTHPQVRAQANEARVYDRENRMELEGNVVATTVVDNPDVEPWLKLQGEALEWRWEDEDILSDQAIRVERFQNARITEVLTGQQGLVELPENRGTLTNNVQAELIEIPLNLTSDRAIWQVDEQTINTEQPIKVVNEEEEITITAQQGRLDLVEQIVYFTQDVVVTGTANDSSLTANSLAWNLVDQTVLAEGAVNYRQSDPAVTVRGPRARGRIEEQTVVVDGGQVVTEIDPNAE